MVSGFAKGEAADLIGNLPSLGQLPCRGARYDGFYRHGTSDRMQVLEGGSLMRMCC